MPYGVRVKMIGTGACAPSGTKTVVCSLTPSRMGIMTSERSKPAAESACCPASGGAGSNRASASSEDTRMGREAYRPRQGSANAQRAALAVDPVRQLHEEGVVGPLVEEIAQIAPEAARALGAGRLVTPLAPHYEQRRAGPVLPAEHDIGAELLVVEPARVVRDRRVSGVAPIAAGEVGRARGVQLLHVAVGALGDEGLRVHLERRIRGERVREAHGQRELLLPEVREEVMGRL